MAGRPGRHKSQFTHGGMCPLHRRQIIQRSSHLDSQRHRSQSISRVWTHRHRAGHSPVTVVGQFKQALAFGQQMSFQPCGKGQTDGLKVFTCCSPFYPANKIILLKLVADAKIGKIALNSS